VVRIERFFQPILTVNWANVPPLELDAAQTAQVAELAPVLEGKPDVTHISRIELERLAQEFRTQRIIFETARDVFDQMKQALTPGIPASPASARRNRTSMSALTIARGRRRMLLPWMTAIRSLPGSRTITWVLRFSTFIAA